MKIQDAQVFDFTDGYERLVEPQSQSLVHGWQAVAWNHDLGMTGWWQGRNVCGISTDSQMFDMARGDVSQAVQFMQSWNNNGFHPFIWDVDGMNDRITLAADVAMPVSYGTNLRQGAFLLRLHDTQTGYDLWIQPQFFNNKYSQIPLQIERDAYTPNGIVVTASMQAGSKDAYFDFTQSEGSTQSTAFNALTHYEFSINRYQFAAIVQETESRLGIDLSGEPYQYTATSAGLSIEQASFMAGQDHGWGIGDTGGMQLAFEHLTFTE